MYTSVSEDEKMKLLIFQWSCSCTLEWCIELFASAEYQKLLSLVHQLLTSAVNDVNDFCRSNSWLSDIWCYCSTWNQSQLAQLNGAPVFVIEVFLLPFYWLLLLTFAISWSCIQILLHRDVLLCCMNRILVTGLSLLFCDVVYCICLHSFTFSIWYPFTALVLLVWQQKGYLVPVNLTVTGTDLAVEIFWGSGLTYTFSGKVGCLNKTENRRSCSSTPCSKKGCH